MLKNIKRLLKEAVEEIFDERYYLSCIDELMEYMWVKPQFSGLNVDVFVDDGGAFKRNGHKPLLFIRNGYSKENDTFIVMTVSNKPTVLNKEMGYNISYDDIFAVQDFIQNNLALLLNLANENISHQEFINSIQKHTYAIAENKNLLNEMATLRTKDSSLPMDVWLDEGATYQGHAPRLKFRASNEQRTTREYSSMLLTNPPTVENMPKNSPITNKDMRKLEEFVINNLDNLLKLANGEIDYVTEFLPNMIKG